MDKFQMMSISMANSIIQVFLPWSLQFYRKRDPGTGATVRVLQKISEHRFLKYFQVISSDLQLPQKPFFRRR